MQPRVLLADDHRIVAEGLVGLLEPEFELVGTVEDGRALLEAVDELEPDVVVTDISMPSMNGIEALRRLSKKKPRPKVVVLTVHADVSYITEAFRAGASGYVLKQSAAEELRTAIRSVLQGRRYLTPLVTHDVLDQLLDGDGGSGTSGIKLTPREREILQLLAEGRSVKEIASLLSRSTRTVEFHKYNLMEKLRLRTAAELTQYAIKHGLVSV